MSFSKADVFGEVSKGGEGNFSIDPERVLERVFSFDDSVMFLHCSNCGQTYEISENFKQNLEASAGLKVLSENQYFQVETCHSCSGKPRVDGATLQEISIN